jgi:uncharacterized phage-associated protein
MNTCFDVANYFLKRQDLDAGDLMSNMKLQKLVYYAQGFNLAITNAPLFKEPIEAWDHGPVCVPLYHEYKLFGAEPIPIPYDADALSVFSEKAHEILDMVHTYYGQFSAWKLRNLTHEEQPWIEAFAKDRSEISHDDMRNYFKTQLIEDEND